LQKREQAALAREADANAREADIAHQLREAKLREVDSKLDSSRQLNLMSLQIWHAAVHYISQSCEEEDLSSSLQATGNSQGR
jgi:hypothetical protein